MRLELFEVWTQTVCERMRLCVLYGKTTFNSSNSNPVILDEWRDVWSLVSDTVFVRTRRKWDNMMTFSSQKSLFSSVWRAAGECFMKILQYLSAIQKQNAVTTRQGKTELTFALRHWQIYKLELQKWSNPQWLRFCFALCQKYSRLEAKVKGCCHESAVSEVSSFLINKGVFPSHCHQVLRWPSYVKCLDVILLWLDSTWMNWKTVLMYTK